MLQLRDVSVTYDGANGAASALALEAVNLVVNPGDFVVALGPSGCGKTTLLNVMAGFLRPTAGQALLDGEPIRGPGRDRGVVFQKHALLPWQNVLENAAFGLRLQKVPRTERRRTAMTWLERLGLADVAKQPVFTLSGGMQQRLGLARALAASPRILLMDEPFGALDALTRESMQELILAIRCEQKTTVFFITHSVDEALFLASRLLVLSPRPGRVRCEQTLDFATQYARGGDSRAVKSSEAFIAAREEVLSAVLSEGQGC